MATIPTTAPGLLTWLEEAGLAACLDGHRLAVSGPKRLLTKPLRRRIAARLVDLRELVRARDLPDDRTPDTAAVLAAAGPGWVDLAGLARKSGRSRATVQQALALLIARELVLTHAGVVTVGRLGGDPRPMTLYRDARLGAFGTILLTNETGKGADDADAA